MDSLNHHHLFHFWTVVREGGVTRASEKLHVSQPTVSGQLRELQESLGEKLLVRSGRTVVLTDVGRTVYRYADEIFALGREMQEAVKGRVSHPARLAVGVTMVVPKLVVYQMLEPALELPEPIQLDCIQERPDRLVAELAIYALDLVLADTPAPPTIKVRAYSHLLGESTVSVFGTQKLARAHRRGFPRSLDGAPFLLPSGDSGLRLSLEDWFRQHNVRPRLFAMPTAMAPAVRRQYGAHLVGRLDTVRQRFYAITVERKLRNPAVIAISDRAKALFT